MRFLCRDDDDARFGGRALWRELARELDGSDDAGCLFGIAAVLFDGICLDWGLLEDLHSVFGSW